MPSSSLSRGGELTQYEMPKPEIPHLHERPKPPPLPEPQEADDEVDPEGRR